MAFFEIPGHEPRVVAGWAFRAVLDRATPFLVAEEDVEAFLAASPVKALFLDSYERDQGERLASALKSACDELRRDSDTELAGFADGLLHDLRSAYPKAEA